MQPPWQTAWRVFRKLSMESVDWKHVTARHVPRCPRHRDRDEADTTQMSVNHEEDKQGGTLRMECYSAVRRNRGRTHGTAWAKREHVAPKERNRTEGAPRSAISLSCGMPRSSGEETGHRFVVAGLGERRSQEEPPNAYADVLRTTESSASNKNNFYGMRSPLMLCEIQLCNVTFLTHK